MKYLLIFLCSFTIIYAENEYCQQYIECEDKAQAKAKECIAGALADASSKTASKWVGCDEVAALHDEINAINEKSRDFRDSCVKEKSPAAEALTGKKVDKCAAIAKRLSRRSGDNGGKKKGRKERDPKKAAQKQCLREAKRLKSSCVKLAKCCPIVKECAKQDENKSILAEKKKQLREQNKQCRAKNAKAPKPELRPTIAEKKEARRERKSSVNIAQSVKKAATKKRQAPIGGKKLLLEME